MFRAELSAPAGIIGAFAAKLVVEVDGVEVEVKITCATFEEQEQGATVGSAAEADVYTFSSVCPEGGSEIGFVHG